MVEVELNRNLPIVLQLGNSAENRFPQAQIFNPSSVVIATINLDHTAGSDGYYLGVSNFTMPDLNFVCIQYTVFQNAARTNISNQHDASLDVFLLKKQSSDRSETFVITDESEQTVVVTPENDIIVEVEE